MNVLEQINKFVTTALQRVNTIVELDGREISDITCESVENITETCQRIRFTVTFTEDNTWFSDLKQDKHNYFLDIDTRILGITDNQIYMQTVPLPALEYSEDKTVRLQDSFNLLCDRVYTFIFFIKHTKSVPAFTIDVNDL